jgi:hypothetical protein
MGLLCLSVTRAEPRQQANEQMKSTPVEGHLRPPRRDTSNPRENIL